MAKAKAAKEQLQETEPKAIPADLLKQVKEWTAAYKKVKELEAAAKQLTERMGQLEGPILEGLEVAEIERLAIDGLTVYPQEQLWAKTGAEATPQMVAEAMRKAKLSEFTTFNTQSFSSYVRELATSIAWEEPKEIIALLPKPLQAVIEITNKQSLRARKS
jgi:hypothetical protein